MAKSVLIPLPSIDFDPTEVAVPWKILSEAGVNVHFATPQGQVSQADPVMVTGNGLGPLKYSMMANREGRAAYAKLLENREFKNPLRYDELDSSWNGLILPGGHAPGMRPYLESTTLQRWIGEAFQANKPVGAICHGVVLAARSRFPQTQTSVLNAKKTTALPQWMELFAWNLTRAWMGSYYRTYSDKTVEGEVRSVLKSPDQFMRGPFGTKRDTRDRKDLGFTVRDGNYVSGRWPGDAHRFAFDFLEII